MAVSKRTRFEVFKRDRFTCQYCGRNPPTVILHVDHVVPQSEDGGDDPLNLITSCQDCNLGKSNVPLGQVTRPLAEQMAEAAEKREQIVAFNEFLLEQRAIEEEEIEKLGIYWYRLQDIKDWCFGLERVPTIRTFLRRLGYAQVMDAMDVAQGRIAVTSKSDLSRWKYFCGVCWKKIRRAEGDQD